MARPGDAPVAGDQSLAADRTSVAGDLVGESWRRPWYAHVISFVVSVLVIVPAIWLCDWVLTGFHANEPGGPFAFAAVLALLSVAVQPLLIGLAVRLGWLGVLLLAFLGQAVLVVLTSWILPDVRLDDLWTAIVVAVIIGLVSTLLGWFSSAGTAEVLVSRLVASARRRPATLADAEVDGVVFVQLDGVPFPVLQMAITAGTVPTLSRWVRSGTHTLREWTPKLPATTPASQMGILHGVIDGIPAFRWYDRAEDRILSTGEFRIPGQKRGYRDSHGGGHGWVDLRESIAQSVNTYYYKLALDMGIQRVDEYMLRYGFGQKTGIDLVGGSVVIEYIFGIPGIGQWTIDSIHRRDYNVIMGVQLVTTLLVLAGMLLADIGYALADPRIRYR